jgi:hypothetical protein
MQLEKKDTPQEQNKHRQEQNKSAKILCSSASPFSIVACIFK